MKRMEQYTSKIYISFEDMQDNIPDVQIFLQIWVCIYNKTTEEGIIDKRDSGKLK